MTVYLDSNYICHLDNDGTRTPFETDAFNGKCKVFIEGYRLIPFGKTWTRSDGVQFTGEMLAPTVDYVGLAKAQQQYEEDQAQMSDMQNALEILGVSP